jgi:Zn-dependent protease
MERSTNIVGLLLYFGVFLNLSLAFFNLYPIGPLDGHWLVGLLMPERPRDKWFLFNRHYGRYILIGLVLLGQVAPKLSIFNLVDPLITRLASILFGIPLHS